MLRGAAGGEQVAGAEGVVRGDINGEGRLVFGELADREGVGRVAEALAAECPRGRDAEEAELAGSHEGGARQLLRFFRRVACGAISVAAKRATLLRKAVSVADSWASHGAGKETELMGEGSEPGGARRRFVV